MNRKDHAGRRQEQRHHDENGDYGPSQFHLCASVDLRGLAAVITLFVPESHGGVGEQAENNNEDRRYSKRTKIESPKIDSAGVETGAKMLVGLIAITSNLFRVKWPIQF